MAQLLNEKSEQMEIEKELARKTLEQSVTIKKKYDAFVKDNGDALQRQQLEQYRVSIAFIVLTNLLVASYVSKLQ
jgi:hypothetical protein